jgi:hypothetical protein
VYCHIARDVVVVENGRISCVVDLSYIFSFLFQVMFQRFVGVSAA